MGIYKWIKGFISIPLQYRVNPFKVSSSGDLYFADKRNLECLDEAIRQFKNCKVKILTKDELATLLDISEKDN